MSETNVIQAEDLSMQFGSVRALDKVSFSVRQGEVLGLLGPNGAGKTTSMRILTTYLVPTSGRATVSGYDVLNDALEVRRHLGYLPETAPLYPEMQVDEYLNFVGHGRGIAPNRLPERIDWVVHACELRQVYRRPILELSKGFRQRVGLAQALIHDPEILILDEPTSGLDPLQILSIRALLRKLVTAGKTLIFSTHILQEASAVSDRIVVINNGRIAAQGTEAELRRRSRATERVALVLESGDAAEVEKTLRSIPGVTQVSTSLEGNRLRALIEGAADGTALARAVFDQAVHMRWAVREVREDLASLEEAFIEIIRGGNAA